MLLIGLRLALLPLLIFDNGTRHDWSPPEVLPRLSLETWECQNRYEDGAGQHTLAVQTVPALCDLRQRGPRQPTNRLQPGRTTG